MLAFFFGAVAATVVLALVARQVPALFDKAVALVRKFPQKRAAL